MKTKIFLMLLTLTFANLSWAADKAGNYAIWGSGNKSCFKYNKNREENNDKAFKDYVMGYMTAYNTVSDDTYSISANMNLEEILGWIDDYCGEKQVHGFEQALTSYILEHYKTRFKKPPGSGGR